MGLPTLKRPEEEDTYIPMSASGMTFTDMSYFIGYDPVNDSVDLNDIVVRKRNVAKKNNKRILKTFKLLK